MNKFSDSDIAIVTGGARGIGAAIAKALAASGATVVIADRDEQQGNATEQRIQELGHRAHFLKTDLFLGKAEVSRLFKRVEEIAGIPRILVNNARSGERRDVWEETEATWANTLSVTLNAAFFCMQAAFESMRGRVDSGAIVNVSSVVSSLASGESPSYHAAKAALSNLTRYMAVEGGKVGIRVNAVAPGFIVQDEHRERFLSANNGDYREAAEFCHPGGKVGSSDDIARAVVFLSSDDARFISGQEITVDGGLTIQEPSSLVLRRITKVDL
jgi:3-oxoacyl-[acyl-carrier protein] reductase